MEPRGPTVLSTERQQAKVLSLVELVTTTVLQDAFAFLQLWRQRKWSVFK